MIHKPLVLAVLAVSLAGVSATLLAGSGRASHRRYTIADLAYVKDTSRFGRGEAKKLGVRIICPDSCPVHARIKLFKSMIARHVDAIVTDEFDPGLKPVYREVRKAGILLVSSGDDIAGKRDLWVSQSDATTYGRALSDALASQMGEKGEYAILDEDNEFPIAKRWKAVVESYIPKAYPNMTLVAAITESGAGDQTEIDSIKSFMNAHPGLKGLISVTASETYSAANAIAQEGRIGQIYSAGNGGSVLGGTTGPAGFVRNGTAEVVYGGDPIKLGYLTVWAAHHLLTGDHFRDGEYYVGGPIGRVYYYARHRELRLDEPLTITKQNVDFYAKKF